ncbi:RagB/SusD family nutrient uptake outer membrane protein [Terrimonas ferruginea]|uniref:RagB/SusD family nutrient uptake outer membrane protein n=1 Tax=Terrimonas ferruginea TaxID=249 RepID=UPI0003FE9003|nr:RagB/SusD family nutrient uptake outer membrane protein [Terrimonas ferruginea]
MKYCNPKFTFPVLSMLLLATTGCRKFLEKDPDSNRASIQTPEQMSQLLISAYPKANYMMFSEALSDNADDKSTQLNAYETNSSCYMYEETNATPNEQDSPQMYWSECYNAIAATNQALSIIAKSSDPDKFRSQKGEALVARAYNHFMLVSFFSRFYNAATAEQDMGIPYVDQPEDVVTKKYERKTVAYVFDRIEEDLLAGLPLIDDRAYDIPKYHFTKAAANAFAARFYLVKREYANVLLYANAVFPANNLPDQLRPWNGVQWTAFGAADLRNEYSKSSLASNILLCEAPSWFFRSNGSRYGYSDSIFNVCYNVKAICASNPTWQFEQKEYIYGSQPHVYIPKLGEYFKRASINANFGTGYIMLPLFDAEEVLFNRAEAKVYLGDATGAIADMNTYISKRALNYNATRHIVDEAKLRTYAGTQNRDTALVQGILGLRRLEYISQGMRWFDVQRYGITVRHAIRNTAGTVERTIEVRDGDPRRVLQLPASATLSGLPLNPR